MTKKPDSLQSPIPVEDPGLSKPKVELLLLLF